MISDVFVTVYSIIYLILKNGNFSHFCVLNKNSAQRGEENNDHKILMLDAEITIEQVVDRSKKSGPPPYSNI